MEYKLLAHLTQLTSNVSNLLKLVVIKDDICCKDLDKVIDSLSSRDIVAIRSDIAGFINTFFYEEVEYSDKLWYLALSVLERLLVIAMRLERYVVLKEKEITLKELPITYAKLAALAIDKRKNWDNIVAACEKQHAECCELGSPYVKLFME